LLELVLGLRNAQSWPIPRQTAAQYVGTAVGRNSFSTVSLITTA